MPPRSRPLVRFAALLAGFTPLAALAHPGHDDPEITWDFSHLVEHPIATLLCFGVLLGAMWLVRVAVRRAGEEDNGPTDSRD